MYHLLPVFVLVFASILWGLSWLPLKALNQLGVEGIPLLLVSHVFLTALFLFPGLKNIQRYTQSLRFLFLIAVFGGGAILCFTYALIYGDIIRVMVLFYLLPVWGVFGGVFFLGEKPDFFRWLGVGLALVGAFLILGGFDILTTPPKWIDVIALCSGLFFAANNICFRGVDSVPLPVKLFFMFAGCGAIASVLVALGVQSMPHNLSATSWWWVILYAGTWLLCANLGSQWAVTKMEAGRSSIIIIVELVVAVISALVIAGERLGVGEWIGCALIVTAALIEAGRDFIKEENQKHLDICTLSD